MGEVSQAAPWTPAPREEFVLGAAGLWASTRRGRRRETRPRGNVGPAWPGAQHSAAGLNGGKEPVSFFTAGEILFITALETTAETMGNCE